MGADPERAARGQARGERLIREVLESTSCLNWLIGERAIAWMAGHHGSIEEFATRIGMKPEVVEQRMCVATKFGRGRSAYPNLLFGHFVAALQWDDAATCLQWASEMDATVSEMRGWRQAQTGEPS